MPSISGKAGKTIRRKSALSLLEKQYETFKTNGVDKPSRTSHKWVNGKSIEVSHPGRSYAEECARLKKEIDSLREKLILS